MAYDEAAAARVRRALAGRRGITEKKMMGALCFMSRGTMCCGVTGDALMVRVGRENYATALELPHVRPLALGQRAARGFILVDPPGYRATASLAKWVERGLAVARALRAETPRRNAAPVKRISRARLNHGDKSERRLAPKPFRERKRSPSRG